MGMDMDPWRYTHINVQRSARRRYRAVLGANVSTLPKKKFPLLRYGRSANIIFINLRGTARIC